MEERKITISRINFKISYPANFLLVASMNPCNCGLFNHPFKLCSCPPGAVQRYLNKISGPLLDRIDLHIEVTPVPPSLMIDNDPLTESSAVIRERVIAARNIQTERFKNEQHIIFSNAQMNNKQLHLHCRLLPQARTLLDRAMKHLHLSARAYNRILKVSRTIADLAGEEEIDTPHIAEAIEFRKLDRESWGQYQC